MKLLKRPLSIVAPILLGVVTPVLAHAAPITTTYTGTFAADNSVFSDPFTITTPTSYTFTTTSYASGGIVPVLSLFNSTTGAIVDASGVNTGFGDVSIMDTLSSGSYVLDLTEFPNVAIGNLADGFLASLYPDGATLTGDTCGVNGGMFYNTVTCTKTTGNYALTVTSNAGASTVTPEPATWLLLLAPMGGLVLYGRRAGTRLA